MPRTAFDPVHHGFHFANNFTNVVRRPGPRPFSTRGRCGGMAFLALDHFYARKPLPSMKTEDFPTTGVPPDGNTVSDAIANRLMDSLFAPSAINFATWSMIPDDGELFVKSRQQWDLIVAMLKRGRPQAIGLVRTRGFAVGDNHQVVAYGFERIGNDRRLFVYDNNYPDQEVVLSLEPGRGVRAFTGGSNPGAVPNTETYRGYFQTTYKAKPPPDDWPGPTGEMSSRPAITINRDDRLEAFFRGANNSLFHTWQTAPGSDTWSIPVTLGGTLLAAPVAARNSDGRLEVFYRGTDNAQWHLWQNTPGGTWSDHHSLGGVLASEPAVLPNQNGRLEVFHRGTDDRLHHRFQDSSGWSGWASLGGTLGGSPVAARNQDGRLEVFYRRTDRALGHVWQEAPDPSSRWSGHERLEAELWSDAAAGLNPDGRLQLLYRGAFDHAIFHRWQGVANGWWTGDRLLVPSTKRIGVVLAPATDGRLQAFWMDAGGQLRFAIRTSPDPGVWRPPSNGGVSIEPIGLPAVASTPGPPGSSPRVWVLVRDAKDRLMRFRQDAPGGNLVVPPL